MDAVHYAPHRLVDVRAIGCDFLACSAYKFYGPHVGVLYGRGERLAAVDIPKLQPAPETAPERLETGTLNHEGIAGAAAAVDSWPRSPRATSAGSGCGRRSASCTGGARRCWSGCSTGLGAIDGVRIYGPPASAPRTPTVASPSPDRHADEIADALAEEAVFVSTGDFYATSVVERYGLAARGGLVRAGCAAYTTADEVDRLVDGVARVARRRAALAQLAAFTGMATLVFSQASTRRWVSPVAGSAVMVKVSTGALRRFGGTFPRPTSCAFTSGGVGALVAPLGGGLFTMTSHCFAPGTV